MGVGGWWLLSSGVIARGADGARLYASAQFHDFAVRSGFAVADVLVEGRVHADPEILRDAVGVARGDSIFALDPRAAKVRLEDIAWVRAAHIERRLPNIIHIKLAERAPLALWQYQGQLRLIADDGTVLADRDLARFGDHLLVVGEFAPTQAPNLIRLLNAEAELRAQVRAATLTGGRRWDLKLAKGIEVKLPEDDIAFALRRLAKADDEDGLLSKDITQIDLRDSERIVVRTRPGAVQHFQVSSPGGSNI